MTTSPSGTPCNSDGSTRGSKEFTGSAGAHRRRSKVHLPAIQTVIQSAAVIQLLQSCLLVSFLRLKWFVHARGDPLYVQAASSVQRFATSGETLQLPIPR